MIEPTVQVKVKPDEQYLREHVADILRDIADDISPRKPEAPRSSKTDIVDGDHAEELKVLQNHGLMPWQAQYLE